MKILQSLDIAPHEQDVYFNDVLLTDDNQTLAQAGITPEYVATVIAGARVGKLLTLAASRRRVAPF